MAAKISKGYDYALQEQQADDLDRWQFASEIVSVVMQTPPDWSVRIGVFAKWGEGKTTVLKFLETMLKEKGSVVFTFSPWSVQSWDQLWDDFGTLLYDALTDAGAHLDGFGLLKRKVKGSGKVLEKKGIDKLVSGAAAIIGKDKTYDTTVGVLGKWLKYDAKQVREIRNKLPGMRVVVLIDDLDRCDPQFLPQLLLSLREVLDLPGFVFVLAFDDEIVADALTDSNRAWKNGSIFLEKILDFRFHLPTISDRQKRRFVANAMATYCPFVPHESVTEVLDLLPNNPRKLKSLIRSLTSLKAQIERHGTDELNWVDMWLAQMLKLESHAFFERLLIGNTLEKEVGTKVLRNTSDRRRDKEQGSDDDSIKQLMKEVGVEDPDTKKRLISLVVAIRARASTKFEYICGLAMRPHAVTWKEFRSFFSTWIIEKKDSIIKRWIDRHAHDRSVSIYDVENELFESVMNRRNECLMLAADASSLSEHDTIVHEAENLLEIVRQDLLPLKYLSADRFKKLYGQISAWIGFRKNSTDIGLRTMEEKVLLEIAASANNTISCELLPLLYSQRSFPELELGEGSAERLALQSKCIEILGPKASLEAVSFVNKAQGINSLRERGRYDGVKFCLFNSRSPVWTSDSCEALITLIKSGRENDTIYNNAQELFGLLTEALAYQVDFVSQHESSLILRNHEFVKTLWETVTFKTIQYRMRIAYLRGRKRLIEVGVPEDLLPMSAELQARMNEVSANEQPEGDSQEVGETI